MHEVSVRRTTLEGSRGPVVLWTLAILGIVATPVIVAAAAYADHWSNVASGLAALIPMWILVTPLVYLLNRAFGVWIAFFGVVALPQLGHMGEHIGQMVQIHWQGAAPPKAHGAVGALDIEYVHFIWNGWVLLGAGLLLMKFRENKWLWVTMVVGVWHFAEHIVIMIAFWNTGKAGDPGLLAKGGDIGGGLNIIRPDLHFIYNLAMTVPLTAAFIWQLRRAREEQGANAYGL
jgi:hypothetical protein